MIESQYDLPAVDCTSVRTFADSMTTLEVSGKNFLWVLLHRNDTTRNTLESGSCGHFILAEHSFHKKNLWNTQFFKQKCKLQADLDV